MRDLHESWGIAAIIANGVAGLFMLVAWKLSTVRKVAFWCAGAAQVAMMVQVGSGVYLMRAEALTPPSVHVFYGIMAFLTVGGLYAYRYVWRARGWMELAYGLGGLFLMGLGVRAVMQVST